MKFDTLQLYKDGVPTLQCRTSLVEEDLTWNHSPKRTLSKVLVVRSNLSQNRVTPLLSKWMKSLFCGEITVLTDLEARVALKELIEKYLKGRDHDYDRLIEVVQGSPRQVPIRGVLEDIRRYKKVQYTQRELELIDDLLYMYG